VHHAPNWGSRSYAQSVSFLAQFAVEAQRIKVPTIGILAAGSPSSEILAHFS